MSEPGTEAPTEKRVRNPLRNEEDAFWLLSIIVPVAAVIIGASLLVGSWLGATVAFIAMIFAGWKAIGWLRYELSEPDEEPAEAPAPAPRRPEGEPGP